MAGQCPGVGLISDGIEHRVLGQGSLYPLRLVLHSNCEVSGDDESLCDGIDTDCKGLIDEDCLIFLDGFEEPSF